MLTLQQCKTILNDNELTDEEIIQMRDWLYQLAELAIEIVEKNDSNLNQSDTY